MQNLCDITIFGGHGDLAFRKLMPALYHLSNDGYLDAKSRIISVSRTVMSREEHCALVMRKLQDFLPENTFDKTKFEAFEKQLEVVAIDFADAQSFSNLKTLLEMYPERERIN